MTLSSRASHPSLTSNHKLVVRPPAGTKTAQLHSGVNRHCFSASKCKGEDNVSPIACRHAWRSLRPTRWHPRTPPRPFRPVPQRANRRLQQPSARQVRLPHSPECREAWVDRHRGNLQHRVNTNSRFRSRLLELRLSRVSCLSRRKANCRCTRGGEKSWSPSPPSRCSFEHVVEASVAILHAVGHAG